MPTPEQIRRYATDPAAFIADLTIPGARGSVRFGDVMADFQRERFASIIPALVAVANGEKPPIGRHWWEATKGASKDSDLACALLWLLAFTRRPLLCQIGAADSDQADELRKAAIAILRLNPWLAQRVDVQASRILSDATGSVAEIIAADTAGSHGARPDVLILNELSHVTKQEFAENLLDNAAKVPHGLVVIATNAGFKGTWQESWRDIARTSDRWHFHVWDKPAPWLDPEEIEEAKRRNSTARYLRLWWGVWSTNSGNAIDAEDLAAAAKQLENLFNSPELPYIVTTAGVDIGWRKDSSAIVVTGANMRTGRVRVLETMAWTPAPGSPVVIGDVEAALLGMHDVYHFAKVNADPREFVSSIQALQLRGVPIVEFPAVAKNDTAMAECAWRMFRERAVDIDVSELRLLADLQRMTIVEKSGNSLKAEFPRTAAGHCDVGQAFILSLPAADEVLATYVPVSSRPAPPIPGMYRDSGMESLLAGRGLPPEYR